MNKEDQNIKISFFENIFYWLWYYFQKVIPKEGMPSPMVACTVLSVFKVFNVFFILTITSVLIGYNIFNILNFLIKSENRIVWILVLLPVVLLIQHIDERLYQRKFDIIKDKIETLPVKLKYSKRLTFLIYLIFTLITSALVPCLSIKYLL